MKKRLVRLLAWAVTAGILVLLFRRIPFHEVVAAARGAAGWTVPAAVFFGFVIYLADSFAIWKTFGWFLAQLSLDGRAAGARRDLSAGGHQLQRRPGRDRLLRPPRGARAGHSRRGDGAAHHGHQRAGAAVSGHLRPGRRAGRAARAQADRGRGLRRAGGLRRRGHRQAALARLASAVRRAARRGPGRSPARAAGPPAAHRDPLHVPDLSCCAGSASPSRSCRR